MATKLTKAQARAFQRRWQLVNECAQEEMHSTSIEVKWQQFNTLLRWAYALGWTDALSEGDAEVRERWMRIRKALRGKKKDKS